MRKVTRNTSKNSLIILARNQFILALEERGVTTTDDFAFFLDKVGIFSQDPWLLKQSEEIERDEK